MIVEDQLDRGAGRIGGIEKLEEFDELAAAVAIFDKRVDLAGEQIDPGQQTERAMTFVLMIAREGRMNARHGRQIRRRRGDGLDSRLLVVGDDRHRLAGFLRLGGGLLQDLDLAIDAENLRHLLLELGVAAFQVVAHLVRLDFLLAEDLTHRALNQLGETFVPRRRSVLARMACQQPRRPQLVRIAVLLGLVARQRNQPSLGLRRDRRLLARSRSVVERRQRRHRPAPVRRSAGPSDDVRQVFVPRQKTMGSPDRRAAFAPAPPGSQARFANAKEPSGFNLLIGHRQFDHLPPSCHDATPRSSNCKRGIHQQIYLFHDRFHGIGRLKTMWSRSPVRPTIASPMQDA